MKILNPQELLEAARQVLLIEAEAVRASAETLDGQFVLAVELLERASGRIIVTGMGKSGLVAAKIAATLCSTGTPAFYLHPAEALHGDLGLVTPDDAVLALSKSGRTAELAQLLPLFERLGVPIVALVGDVESPLARSARVVIRLGAFREAGPEDLIPTSSTTAAMAIGDALAIALMKRRGFDASSLAFVHAGGIIGRQARLKVKELMHAGEALPAVPETATLREALVEIIRKKLGVTTITGAAGRLAGILTDGDLKRILVAPGGEGALNRPVRDLMTARPRTIEPEASVAQAVRVMEDAEKGRITALVVVDDGNRAVGVLHLHDCLRPA